VQQQHLIIENAPRVARKQRKPTHNFNVRYRPYDLQPFMLAPVLPGETMKNLLLQARCVSDPVANPLIGWWNEYYFFYVKLRDLGDRAGMEAMLLANTALAAGSTSPFTYNVAGGYDFTEAALRAVVKHYFRDEEEDEIAGSFPIDSLNSLPQCKINQEHWTDSMRYGSDAPSVDAMQPGEGYPEIPPQYVGTPFEAAYAQWKSMQAIDIVPVTFEDYLKTFGVRAPAEEREQVFVPELLRYSREWTYPSNTINPTNGAPTSALSWSIAERADKDRYFAEPGFIFGVTTSRPKVYLKNQKAALGHYLTDAYSWLPALLQPDPFTSLKKFVHTEAGPLAGQADDYWVDLADLFVHGDQFVNFDLAGANGVTLPRPTDGDAGFSPGGDAPIELNTRYATQGDISALFVGEGQSIRVDGRCDLSILSRVTDNTP
jgi:hypothetical protein